MINLKILIIKNKIEKIFLKYKILNLKIKTINLFVIKNMINLKILIFKNKIIKIFLKYKILNLKIKIIKIRIILIKYNKFNLKI